MKTKDWKTEANVMAALGALGHTAEHLAIFDDVDLLRQKLETFAPDVLFNLVEQFKNNPGFDQNIVSFFEMQGLPFTGCGSTGLTLCKHKGISKKILHYHGIHVPNFVVIPRGQRIASPKQAKFPLVVKPVKEEASYGISRASFVGNDEQFRERVTFVHEKYSSDAIAEEYIEGRELYVSLMGNVRLTVFRSANWSSAKYRPTNRKSPPTRQNGTRNTANAGAWRTSSPKISIRGSSLLPRRNVKRFTDC